MRIALVSRGYAPSQAAGVAVYVQRLAERLAQVGHDVHVVCEGHRLSRRVADGLAVHFVPSPPLPSLPLGATADALARAAAVHRCLEALDRQTSLDVVECANWGAEGVVYADVGRAPVVVRLVTPLWTTAQVSGPDRIPQWRERAAIEALLLRECRGYMAISNAIRETLQGCYGLRADLPCALSPIGLPESTGLPVSPPDGPFRVLFLGRLEPRKGIDTFLGAAALVRRRRADIPIDLVGRPGPQWGYGEADVRRACDRIGRCVFHGEATEEAKHGHIRRSHVLVAPSRYESFGIVYLEAMAHGRAAIGCRAGGAPEVVADGETGILVPPADPARLAEAILTLADDPALCRRMGEAGRERFARRFTVDRMAADTLDFYGRVVAAGPARHGEGRP
jgi:glycosyltransferase involved in cell wall biosynthesis